MIHTADLIEEVEHARTQQERIFIMRLIEKSLSPSLKRTYDLIVKHEGIGTPEIAKRLKVAQNQAGNLTKELMLLGLVRREIALTQRFCYRWFTKKIGE